MKRRRNPDRTGLVIAGLAGVAGIGLLLAYSGTAHASTTDTPPTGDGTAGTDQTDATTTLPPEAASTPVDPEAGAGPAVTSDPTVQATHTQAVARRRSPARAPTVVPTPGHSCVGTARRTTLGARTRVYATSAAVADPTDPHLDAGYTVILGGQPTSGPPVPVGSLRSSTGSRLYSVAYTVPDSDNPAPGDWREGFVFLSASEAPSC